MTRAGVLFVLWLAVTASSATGALEERSAPAFRPPSRDKRESPQQAAEQFLRHLYAVYLGLRACAELGEQEGRPTVAPSVTLEDARRALKAVDAAASEAGLDVQRVWIDAAPLGLVTAEYLKERPPEERIAHCRKVGSVFRIDLGNLQNVLTALGSHRSIIEKDF